jgi:heme-degrading monooxygenase HmoA
MAGLELDPHHHPGQRFRLDSFSIPDAAREGFEAAMKRNLAFIRTLPGFGGHVVLEKQSGDSSFNLVTLAVWESQEALDRAGAEVRAHYERIGFDMAGALRGWGVELVRADYDAPPSLQ